MKKILVTLLLAATSVGSYAQGTIQFANIFGTTAARTFLAPIYGPEANITTQLHGNTSTGVPAGTTVYSGGVLNTAGFMMGLFKGETMLASAAIRTSATGALPAGTIAVTTVTVLEALAGTSTQLEIRVWDSRNGIDTWAKVLQNDTVLRGTSGLFTTGLLGGIAADGSIVAAPNTVGWTSFNVWAPVPEPSTIALGVLGLGSLLLFRRRQTK